MFTAIIIEDERNVREFLKKLIIRHLSKKVIVLDKVNSIAKGVEAINKYKPDIVFLNIQLNNKNSLMNNTIRTLFVDKNNRLLIGIEDRLSIFSNNSF